MRRSLKNIAIILVVLSLCLFTVSCSGGQNDTKKETKPATKAAEENKTFTTTDGSYQITVDPEWSEAGTYVNSDSVLELQIAGGITMLQIITQNRGSLGVSLESYSKEVVGYFLSSEELSDAVVESTENVKCGSYEAIKNIITAKEKNSGIEMFVCHFSIKTDTDYMQMVMISTNSNRDKVLEYADKIPETIKPL